MSEEKKKCPYCGSSRLGQPASNFAGRTISRTFGIATGLTLGAAGHFFTLGKAGDKIASYISGNVIEPITDIVKRRYICKTCGIEFE